MTSEQATISIAEKYSNTTGSIFDIQRFSIHDGPGIRTTVFLKGCPLKCKWCHNPESQIKQQELAFYPHKCIGCGRCIKACSNNAITEGESRIDRNRCQLCGNCAKSCPAEALRIIGRTATVEEVVSVVIRDQPFYKTSNGGATISGGEPFYQFEFTKALLKAFKENGLNTAIETSGFIPWKKISDLIRFVDLFLYDIKIIDPVKHKAFCGVDNNIILSNARRLAETEVDIIFRTPIIPGCNDSADDIAELGDFILSLSGNRRLELMPYHKIGSGKYEAIGRFYELPDIQTPEDMKQYKDQLISMGVNLISE